MTETIKEGWNTYGLFIDCPSRIIDIAGKKSAASPQKINTEHLLKNKLF